MTQRQAWTITEVAQRCGVSKSTVRRYREGDRFPNAWKDDAQQWRIPLEDLLAVGWKPVDPNRVSEAVEVVDTPSERVRELESLLALERTKREAAERIAAMAEQNTEDLRRAMRILEGSPTVAPEQPQRRRWWQV